MIINTQNVVCMYQINTGFGINTNFLEANVINVVLLLSGLVYVLNKFLGATLKTRQQKVLAAIQEAEERLKKANARYVESEKQFRQTEMVIKQIEQEAIIAAEKVRQSILDQGKLDIQRLIETGKTSITIAERQVRGQIQQQITDLAISQVKLELEKQMSVLVQSKIVDDSINQLGDTL